MPLKPKEIAISKSCSVKLDDSTIAILAHVYHTADKNADTNDKSWYRYIGRVAKVTDLEAEIQEDKSAEHRLETWTWKSHLWPDDWFFGYDRGNNKAKAARWLAMKVKKAMDWEAYIKLVRDGIRHVASTGKEKQSSSASYATIGYSAEGSDSLFDITDKQQLLSLEGTFFWKDCPLKHDLKANSNKA
jgi:hypothetical protein